MSSPPDKEAEWRGAFKELRDQVNDFVSELFRSYHEIPIPTERKVLRDAVHGFVWVRPDEVPLLDSPLVQRLRDISQTALASYVYPSANHTRFSHSLGVAHMASRICAGLRDRKKRVEKSDEQLLRLAGLLHDVGHCFLSHLSERIIKEHFGRPFAVLSENAPPKMPTGSELPDFSGKEPGEILSYLMVTSERMTTLIRSCTGFASESVGELILGRGRSDNFQWMGDMISGPFDADKLDYIARDCHATGIRAEVDVERIVNGLSFVTKDRQKVLAGTPGIVSSLEQILMAKMQLTSAVYHHHKVRALECMVRGAVEFARENPSAIEDARFRFGSLPDVLRTTDSDFRQFCQSEPELAESMRTMLRGRRILKRALVLSRETFEVRKPAGVVDFRALAAPEQAVDLRALRNEITTGCNKLQGRSHYWLWVDVPKAPKLDKDAANMLIEVGKNEARTLNTYFPTPGWMKAYSEFRATSHVFYWPELAVRRQVAEVATEVLERKFSFNILPSATDCLK